MEKQRYFAYAALFFSLVTACDTDYLVDPDNPALAPTGYLMNNIQYEQAFNLNNQWTAGRATLLYAQYFAQTVYTDESRYQIRNTQIDRIWSYSYDILEDLKKIIAENEDPTIKNQSLTLRFGSNSDQIQISRILMSYLFMKLTDIFGDVPYWSYGQRDKPDFQALRLDERGKRIPNPKYTDAQVIYKDVLAELKDAADKLTPGQSTFSEYDRMFSGDNDRWIRFAHSLRLRLAAHLFDSDPSLAKKTYDESKGSAFQSAEENAVFEFGDSESEAGPWYAAFVTGARNDFALSRPFVRLLQNEIGPFQSLSSPDPRLLAFVKPAEGYEIIIGEPYGFGDKIARYQVKKGLSPFTDRILKARFKQPILLYAEVEFIRSQFEGWNQAHYEKGVKAALSFWGVSPAEIDEYVNQLLPASQETVLTQKYIGLFMDGLEAWTLYRSTGYPKTLNIPGVAQYEFKHTDAAGNPKVEKITFTPLVNLNDIPGRINYPDNEQTSNHVNWKAAVDKLKPISGSDLMSNKIFWAR